jgi:homocysteine S-methyltransferase
MRQYSVIALSAVNCIFNRKPSGKYLFQKKDKRIKKHKIKIIDGGLATELENSGFNLDHSLWSARLVLENPEAIKDVHLNYLKAGANIITTASYQASFPGCMKEGMSDTKITQLLNKTTEIAVEARKEFILNSGEKQTFPLIAASIGPYGAYLANGEEYTGNYGVSKTELYDFHIKRWEILANTEADLMGCETIPSFKEAAVLRQIIDQTPNKQAYISFSCKDDKYINDGTPIIECAEMLSECEEVLAIGINCTAPRYVSGLIEKVREGAPDKEVVVYPNSGEAYDAKSKKWKGESSEEEFSKFAKEWSEKGATIIGGCCRTTPSHIKAICEALK